MDQLFSKSDKAFLKHAPEAYRLTAASSFIDIGSGFGKPVFHAAMYAGCRGKGVEIVPARVQYCMDVYWQLDEAFQKTEGAPTTVEEEKTPEKEEEKEVPKSRKCGRKRLTARQKEARYEALADAIDEVKVSFDAEPNYRPDWYQRTNF